MKLEIFLISTFFFLLTGRVQAQDPSLSVSLYPDTIVCNGQSNGAITFSVQGGQAPYHFEWNRLGNNFVFVQGDINEEGGSSTIGENLYATGYVVNIMDANGASLLDTAFILTPPPILISEVVVNPPSCSGFCDGAISFTPSGGTGLIEVTWGDVDDITNSRAQLCEGGYAFFLRDENGCTQKDLIIIEDPEQLSVTAIAETPTCLGQTDGQLQLEALGGTPPYVFHWGDGAETDNLLNLSVGSYNVTLEDSQQCLLDTLFFIEEGSEINPNIQINYSCGNGSILVVPYPINGQAPYQISWSTGLLGDILYGGVAGDYSLTITDVNGCEKTTPFTIDYVAPLEVTAHVSPVSCPLAQDGSIAISLLGGLPPFDYSWSNGEEEQDVEMLSGGDYTLNVLGNSCALNQTFTVPEPISIEVDFILEQQENNLLRATAFVSGGHSPYLLNWSNGNIGAVANNLEPTLTYSLLITDQSGCTAEFELDALLTETENSFEQSAVSIYPNPVNDWLNINVPAKKSAPFFMQMYDTKGTVVLEKQWNIEEDMKLNMSRFSSGLYLIVLQSDKSRTVFKVVKM